MTIPSLGEGQHFDAVNTIKKSPNSDFVMFWELQF